MTHFWCYAISRKEMVAVLMSERIKRMRKALDLTQQEFADKLCVKRNTVATYERGISNPSDAAVILICKTFGVSETWLRTGEGDMFVQQSREDEIAVAVNKLLSGESVEFKRRLITVLSKLKDDQWIFLEEKMREILDARPAAVSVLVPAPSPIPELTMEQEVEQEVERYRQQLLSEKKRESQASSAYGSGAG